MEVTRKKICLYWLVSNVALSVFVSAVSMLYWYFTYVPEINVKWSPIDDMLGMFIIMPFGWMIAVITPAGWLGILGLVLALYKISFKPLILSAAGAILFGVYWPKYFVGMMGI